MAVLALAALSNAVVACSSDDDSDTTADADTTEREPEQGGTFTYLTTQDPATLAPDVFPNGGTIGTSNYERLAIYDALLVLEPDGTFQMRIAESLESSDGGTTWTLVLRPEVKFSDGTSFDAEAVKSNWDRMADPANESAGFPFLTKVASTDVVDALTLSVTLKAPDPLFSSLVAQSPLIYIGSPTAMEEKGAEFASSPVGAGAFTFEEWVKRDHISMKRNPDYYGTVYLDELIIKYAVTDPQQEYNTVLTGGADAMFTPDLNLGTRAEEDGLGVKHSHKTGGGWNLLWNTKKAPFDDVRARQAVAYAFDAEAMNDALFDGAAALSPTVFDEDSPLYSPVKQIEPNAEKAQALFDELAAEGKPVEFSILAPPVIKNQTDWLQARLSGFENVEVKIDSVAMQAATTAVLAGNWQVSIAGGPRFVDPYPLLHDSMKTGGGANSYGISNPEIDAALEDAATTDDVEARTAAYRTVQEINAEEALVFFIMRADAMSLYDSKRIGAFPTINDGLPDWAGIWKSSTEL
jgi:peptide/nickel transport system substrate-binding protein